jgi:hypothetical protein
LPRFVDLFGNTEAMTEKLVWLPTWHQARLLAQQLGVPDQTVADIWKGSKAPSAGEELQRIYQLIAGALEKKNPSDNETSPETQQQGKPIDRSMD